MPLPTEFFKMSAAGNDFILFDGRSDAIPSEAMPGFARQLCARALSVGADGVIVVERSTRADIRATFYNPDGGLTFCGNGGRCAARLAYLQGMAPARMTVETVEGILRADILEQDVSFEMPSPTNLQEGVVVEAAGRSWSGTFLDTGVPHFVTLVDRPMTGPIEPVAVELRRHRRFGAEGTNVNFVYVAEAGGISIRSYERGVEAETLACATGCTAAALALAIAGRARAPVTLRTQSGASIAVRFEGDPRRAAGVRVEGEARLVFVGHLADEAVRGLSSGV
ncbi:MAG TPA: diaminopimelate epimerase [Candidatus Polarisedimenticolia bacterium]|nr:diaminopimelate epimerase [Candidatus Polarisedimenticolia bacterium]